LQFYRQPRVPEVIITLHYGRWIVKWGCEAEGWLAVVAGVNCAATVPHVVVVVVVVVMVVVVVVVVVGGGGGGGGGSVLL